MTKQYDDTDRGVLFRNDRKETDKHPDYTGNINVDGHDYWLSAWIKDGRSGKFMSLSVKRKDGKARDSREDRVPERTAPARSHEPAPAPRRSMKDEMDDEIPF